MNSPLDTKFVWLGVCLQFLAGAACLGQVTPNEDDRSQRVDAIVNQYIHPDGPGMAVMVIQKGKVLHHKGYGLANLKKKIPITPQTTFDLASVTKQFTATAIMLLHDREKLGFDDDVRKYLPELPVYDPQRPIRIRDLLWHTSGLPDYMDFKKQPARDEDFPTNEEVVQELAKHKRLLFPTGSKCEYSNTGYVVLAVVVHRASGKSLGNFLHEKVFEPLEMKETVVFENRKVVRHHRAIGYDLTEGAAKFKEGDAPRAVFAKTRPSHFEEADAESVIVGDGGIWSNLDDLAKWDAAVREKKLLKAETWEQAFTKLHLDDGSKPDDYGFGWGLTFSSREKLTEVWHDGGGGGFETTIRRYLVPDLTTVILCNIGDFDFDEIEQAIHDLYVPKKPEASEKGPKKKKPLANKTKPN